jgi:hypothetical protein
MSSKLNRNGSTVPKRTSTQSETGEVSAGNSVPDQTIRLRAYEIYLERGQQPGRDLDDWLQAERELERGTLSRAQAG